MLELIFNIPESLRFSAKLFAISAVKFLIIFELSLISFNAKSQETPKHFFSEKGFKIGISFYSIKLPEEQHYKPILFMGNFGWELTKKEKKSKLWIIFEPQLNLVFLDSKIKELEYGINVAFRYKYKLTEKTFFYSQISSGPHFITVSTRRQVNGFIFSDNLAVGLSFFLNPKLIAETEVRFRHVSNANLAKPNWGINNAFIAIGLSKSLN